MRCFRHGLESARSPISRIRSGSSLICSSKSSFLSICRMNSSARQFGSRQIDARLLTGRQRYGDVKVANHHLVPRLLSPSHRLVGIGIVQIVRRVVVVSDTLDVATFGQLHGFGQAIVGLPIEVVVRHIQQRDPFVLAGPPQQVAKRLAAEVHVGHESQQLHGAMQTGLGGFLVIVGSRGNPNAGLKCT